MSNYLRHIDPDLPEEAGRLLAGISTENEFAVPDHYFKSLQQNISGKIFSRVNDEFFIRQQGEIMEVIGLEKTIGRSNAFEVPAGYFEKQEETILQRIRQENNKVIQHPSSKKTWLYLSGGVAAAILLLILFVINRPGEKESFASLLNKTELNEDDLEYFASEEDYYELYLNEVEEMLADTFSNEVPSSVDTNNDVPVDELQNDAKEIKPYTLTDTLKWEHISEEEILEYLLEGEDETLFMN